MEVKKEQLSVATEEAQSRGNQKTELGNIVKKKKQALKFTQVRLLSNYKYFNPSQTSPSWHLLKINNRNTRTMFEIASKIITTP